MFLTIKEIGFFCLIFLIMGVTVFGFRKKSSSVVLLYMTCFLLTLGLLFTYKFAKIANCQSDGFHFQVSSEKMCRGYPYMQSSNPELLKKCGELLSSPEGKKIASCDGMYVGKPYSFEYTPESNDNWENERCKQKPVTSGGTGGGTGVLNPLPPGGGTGGSTGVLNPLPPGGSTGVLNPLPPGVGGGTGGFNPQRVPTLVPTLPPGVGVTGGFNHQRVPTILSGPGGGTGGLSQPGSTPGGGTRGFNPMISQPELPSSGGVSNHQTFPPGPAKGLISKPPLPENQNPGYKRELNKSLPSEWTHIPNSDNTSISGPGPGWYYSYRDDGIVMNTGMNTELSNKMESSNQFYPRLFNLVPKTSYTEKGNYATLAPGTCGWTRTPPRSDQLSFYK